jgi:hypothetical protein
MLVYERTKGRDMIVAVHTKRRGASEWTTVKYLYPEDSLPAVGDYLAVVDLDARISYKVQLVVHSLSSEVLGEIYAVEAGVPEEMRSGDADALPLR